MWNKIEIRPLEICHLKMVYEMGIGLFDLFDWTPEMLAKAYSKNENLQLGAFVKKKLVGYLIALQLEKDGPVKILGTGLIEKFCNRKDSETIKLEMIARLSELANSTDIITASPTHNQHFQI